MEQEVVMNDRSCALLRIAAALAMVSCANPAFAAEDPALAHAHGNGAGLASATPPDDRGEPRTRGGDDEPSPEHFRIGVLGGVGLPRPLAIEAMIKVERLMGVGGDYGVLPTIHVSRVSASSWALAADVRVFPLKGPFFIGLRAGYQHLAAATTVTVANVGSASLAARVDSTFINPRLGFLWTWDPGITLGIDAGVQILLGSKVATDMPALATGTVVDRELTSVANALGQAVLPTIDLLRVGILL
jgi:hypothetical protein